MRPRNLIGMIELEVQQLNDNIGEFYKLNERRTDCWYEGGRGDGTSLDAIKSDIVKIRRDLLKLYKTLPNGIYDKKVG